MQRVDGYLCIDSCDKQPADSFEHYWIYIDGVEYYYKPTEYAYNEVVGYRVAEFLGLGACYCDFAILNGKRGIISKSLRNIDAEFVPGNVILGEFVMNSPDSIRNLGCPDNDLDLIAKKCLEGNMSSVISINNLEVIGQALKFKYPDVEAEVLNDVMEQFILMYLFTIIVNDVDRRPTNWGILHKLGNIMLSLLFDNEWTFRKCDDEVPISLFVDFDDYYSTFIESLKRFFEVYPSAYFSFFLEKFEGLIEKFDSIIGCVEIQIGISIPSDVKKEIYDVFNSNCEKIRMVINEFVEARER